MSGKGAFIVRPSRDADVAAIAAIYGYHVAHGVASFEEVPPSEDEISRRRADILARGLPYLVADDGGRGVGYRFTLEDSIYIAPNEVGRGIGRTLLGAVIGRCGELGYRQMVAVIGGR